VALSGEKCDSGLQEENHRVTGFQGHFPWQDCIKKEKKEAIAGGGGGRDLKG